MSRSVEKLSWGIPVPNDPTQVMYVWFDALAIYITGIGFGTDESLWKKWWPADLHVIGKDIKTSEYRIGFGERWNGIF